MRPVIISYTPDTHESTDHAYARTNAALLDLSFYSAEVSTKPADLEALARTVIGHGYRTKMQVESLAPMVLIAEVAAAAGVSVLYTGDQADGYYINGNWISRNYDRAQGIPGPERQHVREDGNSTRIDALRRIYWDEDRGNCGAVQAICAEASVRAIMPYRDERIAAAFSGTHWREVNEPRLKEPAWQAFPELRTEGTQGIWVREKPVNLHRGDSLFAEVMGRKLMERFPGPWRTPTGLYAAMARGEV
jgi:asparagine synthetase B (glutamine-hydrolysing)